MTAVPAQRPPFRADHVGSLLRPPELREAFRTRAAGRLDETAFADIQDTAICDVVAMQEAAGLHVVTDGEFRRGSYWGRFVEGLKGFVIKPASFKFRDGKGSELDFTAPYAAGKIVREEPLALDEYEFMRGITKDRPGLMPKITVPSPSTLHYYRFDDFGDRGVYPDEDDFFADVAKVFRDEIKALTGAGCRYIQFDEVAVAMLGDPHVRAQTQKLGQDPDALLGKYIDLINEAVAGAPSDCLFGVHMCRGNLKGHFLADGGYDLIAERFFGETNVTHFLLEYDSVRAGDFTPLSHVPKDKGVVLGLVSSKRPALEAKDELKARIMDAARYCDADRLAISPQCGFASTVAGNPVTPEDQSAKLRLCVEVAKEVWG
ncbi:MAG: 5-methyltetrahydropteroyltriglutamate--homocysteine S-methyltransferase [Beijerinckiaceae bacterium]